MALDPEQLARLQRAYEVLGIPQTASAQQIKQAYRKLTKRWHPDLYPAGSDEQADATQMMKLINDAYDQVATAPLRYYEPTIAAPPKERMPYVDRPRPVILRRERNDPPPKLHLFEFCVRFFFGAIFGLLLGFREAARSWYRYDLTPHTSVILMISSTIVFGLLAGFLGDDLWLGLFRRSWWWW